MTLRKTIGKIWACAWLLSVGISAKALGLEEYSKFQNAVGVGIGSSQGGFALGVDYEHAYDKTYGLGGYMKVYPKDRDRGVPSLFTFGAQVRPHFQRGPWDFYLAPGVGLNFISGNTTDETVLGPMVSLGVTYQTNLDYLSIGFEANQIFGWFSSTYRGLLVQDLLVRGRFAF